eukprot:gene5298-7361_t
MIPSIANEETIESPLTNNRNGGHTNIENLQSNNHNDNDDLESRNKNSLEKNSSNNIKKKKPFSKIFILSMATIVFSMSFTITAFTNSFYQLVIIRMIMGFTQSIITPFSMSIISEYFPSHLHGSAFSIFNSGTYTAFSLSLSLGTYVYSKYGWQLSYGLFGAIGILFALFIPFLNVIKAPEIINTHNSIKNLKNEIVQNNIYYKKLTNSSVHDDNSPINSRIRLGGGYLWSGYTGAYFSDLFIHQKTTLGESVTCSYSYSDNKNDLYHTNNGFHEVSVNLQNNFISPSSFFSINQLSCTSSTYPYCINGLCSGLNNSPWHNIGLNPLYLEEYMSWVPIVGSAFGSILGGILSDFLIFRKKSVPLSKNTTAVVSIVDSGNDTSGVNYNNSNDVRESRNSENNNDGSDKSIRLLFAGISNIIALPAVSFSLFLDFPYCFLILILSGMVGEVYLVQSIAVITHKEIVPSRYITVSVALFMLIVTIIGGNFPLLIPLFESNLVGYNNPINITFTAAKPFLSSTNAIYNSSSYGDDDNLLYHVPNKDARQLQYSLLYLLIISYGLSGTLFLYFNFAQSTTFECYCSVTKHRCVVK